MTQQLVIETLLVVICILACVHGSEQGFSTSRPSIPVCEGDTIAHEIYTVSRTGGNGNGISDTIVYNMGFYNDPRIIGRLTFGDASAGCSSSTTDVCCNAEQSICLRPHASAPYLAFAIPTNTTTCTVYHYETDSFTSTRGLLFATDDGNTGCNVNGGWPCFMIGSSDIQPIPMGTYSNYVIDCIKPCSS